MKYIFDRVGIDASAGNMLRVPNDDYENFPAPFDHRGGFYYDTEEEKMYYSDGINWSQVGTGNVTSVNATASGALSVTGGPIVTTGVLNFNWTGTSDYLVQGDGTLILKTSIIPVVSPSALTKIDDTNVTLALGGSPASALLQNVSLTLGWNGVLSTTRGGTGLGSLGTANQLLRVNTGATALEYVTLNPIAFNGLAIPSGELVYGTGTSVTSLNKYRVVAGEGIVSGDGIGVAYFGMYAGNGVNEGGALRIKRGSNFVTYIGSDCAAFGGNNDNTTIFAYGNNSVNIATNSVRRLIVDGNGYVTINNIPTASSSVNLLTTNGGVIETRTIASLGFLTTSTAATTYVPYVGATNDVDLGSNNFKIGNNIGTRNITLASGNSTGDASYIMFKRGGSNKLLIGNDTAAFGGNNDNTTIFAYGNNSVNIATNSVRRLIVDGNGYVTINNIPTAASATDILVSNGGVVSTRTVASLGIPVITPAALTKTDDTNVTISLGGTPATALLQGVSLTMGWAGVLAISRGGTGLGTLGTANQLLRVNSGETALEYFTPTWTSNTGTVTSVAATIAGNAATVTGSPITTSGTLAFTWLGSIYQYVRGDGTLAYLPPSANYLNDLLDVTITSPGTGQLLRYNGTEWVNWTPNFLTSNQTITLSGDVTGSGATSIVTTIAANAVTTSKIANTAVTFAKIQNINTNRLLGRSSAGSGSVEEISIGSGLSLSGGTLSASGGGGSAVWKVQGGSTDATTNTQNIYHNANVWLGDGSGSSSSYRLQVSGTSYLTGSVTLNNITTIQAWNNAASQQLKIAQLDSSNIFNYAENYLKIVGQGGNAGDITISAYPHTRKDTLSAYPRNVLVTNSSGNLLSLPGECYKNDNVNTALSSDESHSADSTWRTVTWDTVNTPSWSHYGKDTTSGNMKMKLPTSTYEYGTHLILVTLNYTGGTASEVNAEVRINGSTVIGSATTNATASKNTLTFFTVIDNNATYQGSVVSLHLRIASGTGSITLKAGSKMVMIAGGAPLPA
jgi:hypothetical protein